MADKNKHHIPKPGLPEAIHPEIGNGAAWAEDAHAFLLRTPDPAIKLAGLLKPDEIPATAPVISAKSPGIEAVAEPDESAASTNTRDNPEVAYLPEEAGHTSTSHQAPSEPIQGLQAEAVDDITPKGKKKKKAGKGNGSKNARVADLKDEPVEENPAKAGKLVRKAAKSLQKQEELKSQEAKPEKIATEQALSPYTSWLKSLTGSEYVHPYEDDFAFTQSASPSKEGISETFADLLAAQGYKEQAIEMYIKLIEKYPEKSGFFAAKIEALQQ